MPSVCPSRFAGTGRGARIAAPTAFASSTAGPLVPGERRPNLDVTDRLLEHDRWNDSLVDALCDPPQSLAFGGVNAHVVTYSAYRRQVLRGTA